MAPGNDMQLLLVEDSEDDLFFFKRLCKKALLACNLAVATDGQQAIDWLGAAAKGEHPQPQLVFLDLKLPLRGGFEVLQWLRQQPAFARMVVVVLSSSAETRDVQKAFELGAQGYLVKYPEPAVLAEVVRTVAAMPPDARLESLVLPGLKHPS